MTEQTLEKTLINAAISAAEYAYIPYSQYPVGAALMAAGGSI